MHKTIVFLVKVCNPGYSGIIFPPVYTIFQCIKKTKVSRVSNQRKHTSSNTVPYYKNTVAYSTHRLLLLLILNMLLEVLKFLLGKKKNNLDSCVQR